jgi:hypothetical protein
MQSVDILTAGSMALMTVSVRSISAAAAAKIPCTAGSQFSVESPPADHATSSDISITRTKYTGGCWICLPRLLRTPDFTLAGCMADQHHRQPGVS